MAERYIWINQQRDTITNFNIFPSFSPLFPLVTNNHFGLTENNLSLSPIWCSRLWTQSFEWILKLCSASPSSLIGWEMPVRGTTAEDDWLFVCNPISRRRGALWGQSRTHLSRPGPLSLYLSLSHVRHCCYNFTKWWWGKKQIVLIFFMCKMPIYGYKASGTNNQKWQYTMIWSLVVLYCYNETNIMNVILLLLQTFEVLCLLAYGCFTFK